MGRLTEEELVLLVVDLDDSVHEVRGEVEREAGS